MTSENYWQKITIHNGSILSEFLSSFLIENGATGLDESGTDLQAYFPKSCQIERVKENILQFIQRLKFELSLKEDFYISSDFIKNENWQQNWMKYFKPIFVEDRLVITPSWEKVDIQQYQILITIDPQQAFGTGGHASTYLILQMLLKYHQSNIKVLDIGTGSGILAFAAAKLASKEIVAFDIDPVAVKTALKNCELNEVTDQIHFFTGELNSLNPRLNKYDLILANITFNVLNPLIPQISSYLKSPNSLLILSGLLVEEQTKISDILTINQFKIVETKKQEEWMSIVCSKSF